MINQNYSPAIYKSTFSKPLPSFSIVFCVVLLGAHTSIQMEMKFSYMKFLFFHFLWWHCLHNLLVFFCYFSSLLSFGVNGCSSCCSGWPFQSVECVKIPALSSEGAGRLGWEQPKSQFSLEPFSQAQLYQSDQHQHTDISGWTANKSEISPPVSSCEPRAPQSRHILSSRRREAAGETTNPRDLHFNPSLHTGFLVILAHQFILTSRHLSQIPVCITVTFPSRKCIRLWLGKAWTLLWQISLWSLISGVDESFWSKWSLA